MTAEGQTKPSTRSISASEDLMFNIALAVISAMALVLGFMLGFSSARVYVSEAMGVMLIAYLLSLVGWPKFRLPFLGIMTGIDIGSLVFDVKELHVRLEILPLVEMLTSSSGRTSIYFDYVQLILVLELIWFVLGKVRRSTQ